MSRPYKPYSDDQLRQAVSAVKQKRLSISKASREFGIPITTIGDYVRGRSVFGKKPGRTLELTKEEEESLVNFIKYMADHGFPMSRTMIRCYIRDIVRKSGRETRLNLTNGPSDEWFRHFFCRFPEISERRPENMDAGRTRMSNGEVMVKWFTFLDGVLSKYGIKDMPDRIYNCDETGWTGKESARAKVSGRKNGHIFRQKTAVSSHVTAHLCVCADGRFLPSMIIFQGSLPHRNFKDGIPSAWYYGTSESGYMDGELFLKWFQSCFLPNCVRERPVCLIMDNHDSHLTLPLVEMAIENNVILVGLPAHTTHILQPLDVKIIAPLKGRVANLADRCGFLNSNFTVSKARFPVLLSYAIDQTTPAAVKEAFEATGICPLNGNSIDKSQLVPASFKPQDAPQQQAEKTCTKTCPTCGAYNINPLVHQGLVPKGLAAILMPPPHKPQTDKKKSRVVLEGRLISGEEMLNKLKEREKVKEEKLQRQMERKRKRELKEEETLRKKATKSLKKKENQQKKDKKREQRDRVRDSEQRDRVRDSRLASVIYTCGVCDVRGRVDDEVRGIEWVGCDEERCLKWFHYDCLCKSEQEYVTESLSDGSEWFCKLCKPWLYDEE